VATTARSTDLSRRSIAAQVGRAAGFTALVVGLIGVGVWVSGAPEASDNGYVTFRPHWALYGALCAAAAAGFFLVRRVRRWVDRPRWLLPAAAGILIVAAVPALKPYTISPELTPLTCVPLLDAWHPVIPHPGPTNWAVWTSIYSAPPPSTSAEAKATLARVQAEKATSAYATDARYAEWTFGPGECVAKSRRTLAISLAVLGGGSAAVVAATALVKRRRRANIT
jgi:hypothetical protein